MIHVRTPTKVSTTVSIGVRGAVRLLLVVLLFLLFVFTLAALSNDDDGDEGGAPVVGFRDFTFRCCMVVLYLSSLTFVLVQFGVWLRRDYCLSEQLFQELRSICASCLYQM